MTFSAVIEAVIAADPPGEPGRADRLLPVLHEIQHRIGHVPDEAVPPLARRFNLSRAEVHGVISFYRHFRRQPGGSHRVELCQAEACQSMGANALREHAEERVGCRLGQTSADGLVTLEATYCLGQCAAAPALMLDHQPLARMTPERFDELLASLRAGGDGVQEAA